MRLAERTGGPVTVLATGVPGDEELRRRVAAHRARRPAHWSVVEEPLEIAAAVGREAEVVLLESVDSWLFNRMERQGGSDTDFTLELGADLVLRLTPVLPVEEVPLSAAWGRVLGEDLVAPGQLPPFPASAVDGYAFRAGRERRLRVVGESAAGRPFLETLPEGAAARILTGGILPAGADTVVMVEDVVEEGDAVVVPDGFPAGRNFHPPGADLREGEPVLRKGL